MNASIKLVVLFFLLSLIACDNSNSKHSQEKATVKGVDLTSMKSDIDPCHDFYQFANGGWIESNPIPETESRWSNFNVLHDKNDSLIKDILENAASSSAEKGSSLQKIGDFYKTAMDTSKINELGISAIQDELDRIKNIKTSDDLTKLLAHHHQIGVPSLFSINVGQDIKNNTEHIVYLSTGNLGLPDRDYYLLDNPKFNEIKKAYLEHLAKMFVLMGYDENTSKEKAQTIMNLETDLAKKSLTRVEKRNPNVIYNKKSFSDLSQLASTIKWKEYINQLGIDVKYMDSLVVTQPKFIEEVNQIISKKYDMKAVQSFLEWNLINTTASTLNKELEEQDFYFYFTVLRGVEQMKPRWKRALSQANGYLGELIGQEYVKVAFSPENKAKVNEMVDNLVSVFSKRIESLDWMSEDTKHQALTKLKAINRKLGYPDEWKDFSNLDISEESYVQNTFNANKFEFNRELAKLGQPVNKKEWGMSPQTVNAYYNPVMNEIVFPAGILQPPFFDITSDDAINYGSMGAVIGHELTHGFDDQGNRYDADGNLKNWWTEEDKNNFNELAQKVVAQYNEYEILDSVYINGQLTLGENIADIGGLSIAYEAYMKSLENTEKEEIDGFTPEQRFFISFAQVWRNNQREEAIRQQVMVDPHSPAEYRVIGVLSNLDEFDQAFDICKDKRLADSLKIKIW